MVANPFVWGRNGQRLTQSDIENQRAVANALIRSGTDMSPFAGNGWVGALGKGAQAALGAFEDRDLDAKAAANLKATTDADSSLYSSLAGTLGGDTSGALPTPGAVGEVAATSPQVSQPADVSGGDKQSFISNILPLAIEQGQRTGVDPRIIVAQAAQESGWGAHAPGNNYFGIKSHGQDGGNTLATTEYVNGYPTQTSDSFRGYGSLADSVKGYGDFILQNPRYSGLRTAQGLDGQLAALGASGYATDPHYANSVGAIARAIQLPDGTAPVIPVQTASLGPVTPQDATAALAPAGPYVDPQVTTAYAPQAPQAPNPAVAQALLAPPQDTTSAAMPVSDALAQPLDPSTVQDYGTQPPQAVPSVASQLAASPSVQRPSLPTVAPLNPIVIQTLKSRDASPQAKQVALGLLNNYQSQQQNVAKAAQAQSQAQYEANLKQADPVYQQTLRKAQYENDHLGQVTPDTQAQIDAQASKAKSDADNAWVLEDHKHELGAADPTNDIKDYKFAQSNGYKGSFTDYQISNRKAGATTNTIDTGEGNRFYNTLDDKNAATFSGLSDSGIQARPKLAQINQLDKLLQAAPSGAMAVLKQKAGDWGINTDGLTDLQAANALLSQMIPQQRPPGSGPVSDADLAGFRNSLPRLINQPGGNATIINTMRGLTQYQIDMGGIADRVANREITPAEGREKIANLANPLANFSAPPPGKEADGWKDYGNNVRVREVK